MSEEKNKRPVRCRFAPSPTGYLHLGGARTALFNYLFAKSCGGTYILRIEDTDEDRNLETAVQAIFAGLEWLKITPDEGPFFQSQRLAVYQDYARKLLASGHAYRCYASADELEEMRNRQIAAGEKAKYDGRARPAAVSPQPTDLPGAANERPFVIRLRLPEITHLNFEDLVLGHISTPVAELEDFIILRSDGTPTYNFVVVVDDIEMQISHVIRGSDHVSNTPKQVAIYLALSQTLPKFAHVPMILGSDKQKLSKRHGATSVIEYKQDGYLPDALVNYLVRLGWSHGNQEIFTREELERVFNLEHIGSSPAVFDFSKLRWVNAEHMKLLSPEVLLPLLKDFLKPQELKSRYLETAETLSLIGMWRERCQTLIELAGGLSWFLEEGAEFPLDDKQQKAFAPEIKAAYLELINWLTDSSSVNHTEVEAGFKNILENHKLGMGKLGQPVRLALSGSMSSPALFSIFELLGKERSLSRLQAGLRYFPES